MNHETLQSPADQLPALAPAPCWAPWPDMECIARLLAERGFQLSRGTWEYEGIRLPSVVITRPNVPEWPGVWGVWEPDDADAWGEAQTALSLAGQAIEKWQREFLMYALPNAPDEPRGVSK